MRKTTAHTEHGASSEDDVRRLITFEEARLALLLDQRIHLLATGEATPRGLPIDGPGAEDLAELLDIASLLHLRGRSRRALI